MEKVEKNYSDFSLHMHISIHDISKELKYRLQNVLIHLQKAG